MKYTTLGSTGMEVSRICLSCMSFGATDWKNWLLSENESRWIINRAIELAVNFFDTAGMYSYGESERILGGILSGYNRDEMVVATKIYFPPDRDPHRNATGLSRKTIEQELEASLDRLGMDTIDLYQIHRWDYDTPIEETLRALDDAVRQGKVRYIGASSMWAYQFAEALHKSEILNLERFQTMQNHYNLLYREEEREMMPLCRQKGVGVIPWSPLARGYLARPHDEIETTLRGRTDEFADRHPYFERGGKEINERVREVAHEKSA
jgi:aryl-alcohol dehydrogenase-like predicted oxidoreductase